MVDKFLMMIHRVLWIEQLDCVPLKPRLKKNILLMLQTLKVQNLEHFGLFLGHKKYHLGIFLGCEKYTKGFFWVKKLC